MGIPGKIGNRERPGEKLFVAQACIKIAGRLQNNRHHWFNLLQIDALHFW